MQELYGASGFFLEAESVKKKEMSVIFFSFSVFMLLVSLVSMKSLWLFKFSNIVCNFHACWVFKMLVTDWISNTWKLFTCLKLLPGFTQWLIGLYQVLNWWYYLTLRKTLNLYLSCNFKCVSCFHGHWRTVLT